MKRLVLLLTTCMLYLHTPAAYGKIQFKNRVSVTAYKIDPATQNDTWSIQTTNSPRRGALKEEILSSSIVISSIDKIVLLKHCPTYVFVYKNPRAAEQPIRSLIRPEDIRAAGNNPAMIINGDGTVKIVTRKAYEAMQQQRR